MRAVDRKVTSFFTALFAFLLVAQQPLYACTGITLIAADESVVYGRTLEWGAFDLKSRIIIIPRGYDLVGSTPDNQPGVRWKSKFGVVGIDALEHDIVTEGMNETGLTLGVFYHPGFAEYQQYHPDRAEETMGPLDVGAFILTQFSSVEEVRSAMKTVRIVPVVEPALGFTAPLHFMVTEPSGKSIVIEYLKGELTILDNPLGVITNSPSFDWHLTNLRNFINLSPVALPGKTIEDLDFTPLGGGSGMICLPGDFTIDQSGCAVRLWQLYFEC